MLKKHYGTKYLLFVMHKEKKTPPIFKQIPWLYILIILIWLLVLGLVASRYFDAKVTHGLYDSKLNSSSAVNSADFDLLENGDLLAGSLNSNSSAHYSLRQNVTTLNNESNHQKVNLQRQILYTPLGEVHAIYDHTSGFYTLFVNQLPLSQLTNPNVIYTFSLNKKHIVLIFDAEIIGNDPIYTILDLEANNKRVIHEVGNYQYLISAELGPVNKCIYLKFEDERKYTESGDYQVYQYCGRGVYKVFEVKPEDYYQKKFASYTPQKIIDLIKKDNCWDHQHNGLAMTRPCNYGIKYCYIFKSLNNPKHDQNYKVLAKVCQN